MNIIGTLELDPVVLATGKDRSRIIRRHSQMMAICVRAYVPHLDGHMRRRANQLDKLLHNDPNYWIRRKGQVSAPGQLENLLAHARTILDTQEEYPEVLRLLRRAVFKVDEDMVQTRRELGWAILRVAPKHIRPFLDEIRADGTKISQSAWGPHISVIRGELRRWTTSQKSELNGKEFQVKLAENLRSNRRGYYWLDVESRELETLRTELGLPPRPSTPFHLTIGKRC